MDDQQRRDYWRRNLRLMAVLLVDLGPGVVRRRDPLRRRAQQRRPSSGFPLGFWFAQQGSPIVFVILIAVYVWRMDKLDDEFGVDEYEGEVHHS